MITENAIEFRDALPAGGMLLGLDPGTKTIGTALCDAEWCFATAGKTLPRTKFTQDKAALEELIKARNVRGLVIGLPLNMDGSDSPRTQSVRALGRNLVVLDLPLAPVCRDDCPGLCPQCGFRLEDDPNHSHDVIDPRWAALGALTDETSSARTNEANGAGPARAATATRAVASSGAGAGIAGCQSARVAGVAVSNTAGSVTSSNERSVLHPFNV